MAEGRRTADRKRPGAQLQHDDYLKQLTRPRNELKAGLAGVPPEDGCERPSVAELAEKIKNLKAGITVEAAPQRAAKRASAEEPVTARIRKSASEADGEWRRRVSDGEERKSGRA